MTKIINWIKEHKILVVLYGVGIIAILTGIIILAVIGKAWIISVFGGGVAMLGGATFIERLNKNEREYNEIQNSNTDYNNDDDIQNGIDSL